MCYKSTIVCSGKNYCSELTASERGMKKRKIMLKGKHKEVKSFIYLFLNQYLRGLPVIGLILQEKALQFF